MEPYRAVHSIPGTHPTPPQTDHTPTQHLHTSHLHTPHTPHRQTHTQQRERLLFNSDRSVGEWVGAIIPSATRAPAASSFHTLTLTLLIPTDTLYTGSDQVTLQGAISGCPCTPLHQPLQTHREGISSTTSLALLIQLQPANHNRHKQANCVGPRQ